MRMVGTVCPCLQHWELLTSRIPAQNEKIITRNTYVKYFSLLHTVLLPDDDLSKAEREELVAVSAAIPLELMGGTSACPCD